MTRADPNLADLTAKLAFLAEQRRHWQREHTELRRQQDDGTPVGVDELATAYTAVAVLEMADTVLCGLLPPWFGTYAHLQETKRSVEGNHARRRTKK